LLLLCLSASAQDSVFPQSALSPCVPLSRVSQEDVAPGTGIAVSADGRRLAQYFHTPTGAELTLHDRDFAEVHRVTLDPPSLPPGIPWRITAVALSPAGDRLAVQSIGAVWMLSAETGEILYRIDADFEKQLYPGQLSLAANKMLLALWPPESLVADAKPKHSVEVRIYDATSGQVSQTLFLPLTTADPWTRLALSPGGTQIAALMRTTRWPGKARLALYQVNDGKKLWEKKFSAEDLAWSADAGELLLLGNELLWVDAATGKKVRAAQNKVRSSEDQTLRTSEPANLAVGFFLRYNPFKRLLAMNDTREPQFLLWRLDTGQALCALLLDDAQRVDAWPTARGEIIALEETYDVRPSLRILRAAQIVTYRVER